MDIQEIRKVKMKNCNKITKGIIKKILSLSLSALIALIAVSCNKDDKEILTLKNMVDTGDYKLFTETLGNGNHTIVFESGFGDNYESWYKLSSLSETNQVIAYNRGGYAPSEVANNERNIIQLAEDLHQVILSKSKNDSVILIGHSLGGAVIRYYAVQHPEMVEALIFVDPTHEDFEVMTQAQEDRMVEHFNGKGLTHIAKEGIQFIENFETLTGLAALPNVPTVVLTSIKDRKEEDGEHWVNVHATLGEGITNFTHVVTENSGHYIQIEEPQLVLDAIDILLE